MLPGRTCSEHSPITNQYPFFTSTRRLLMCFDFFCQVREINRLQDVGAYMLPKQVPKPHEVNGEVEQATQAASLDSWQKETEVKVWIHQC